MHNLREFQNQFHNYRSNTTLNAITLARAYFKIDQGKYWLDLL